MADQLGDWTRTDTCGALRAADIGQEVTLLGWVHRVRDLGALVFLDVRDRYGLTQVVVQEGQAFLETAKHLRAEFVVGVKGRPCGRAAGGRGQPEHADRRGRSGGDRVPGPERGRGASVPDCRRGDAPPTICGCTTGISTCGARRCRRNFGLRHRVTMAVRQYLDRQGLLGDRDAHPGEVDARRRARLPRAEPRAPRRVLRAAAVAAALQAAADDRAAFDRYFQIVRCFRDEDLRADRQPEFTQIDIEMSFARPTTVFGADRAADAARSVEDDRRGDPPCRSRGMPYAEAMARYGSDKPDLRFGMEIQDVSPVLPAMRQFTLFREAVAGGRRRARVRRAGRRRLAASISTRSPSRRRRPALRARVGASGRGRPKSPALKAPARPTCGRRSSTRVRRRATCCCMAAGGRADVEGARPAAASRSPKGGPPRAATVRASRGSPTSRCSNGTPTRAGSRRCTTRSRRRCRTISTCSRATRRRCRAQAYDLVLNGSEIGGGSIRIHDAGVQARVFRAIGLDRRRGEASLRLLPRGADYGTPPHGGIALGLDRIVAMLAGESSIREVIAFPKTAAAVDLMTEAPSRVDDRQLRELKLRQT